MTIGLVNTMVFTHLPFSLLLTLAFAPSFWVVAPSFAGFLMQHLALGTPLISGAGMKIGCDILLYLSFRGIKPPEEK